MTRPFRLALPSKGRLHAPALELARAAGVEVDLNGRALHAHCSRWDIEVLFARADDIPAWTADGAVDAAVAGRDLIVEAAAEVDELVPLGFGRCALEVAVPAGGTIAEVGALDGGRVATAHPRTAAAFFASQGLTVDTVPIRGSVELAPRLDAADGIVDLVSSGDTLRQNGLRPIATVLESEAVLVARSGLGGRAQAVAGELATVIESVVAARDKRYLMLNAPDESLDDVIALLPGMDSPTVLPLARGGLHAVHAVVDAEAVADLLAPLRAAGARSLLVLPIQNLIP
ncbi:MAG TPA: ATP phosphoribosyltransferase [Gaiellales bacterium]|nr:ATP phosphoribosyltransferase [Gaiellales bacterium]